MILKNCRLIPELCEGFQEEMADIRIEGTDIVEILPCGGKYVGEEVIDCAGKTVMPGLHDIHSHLFFHSVGWYSNQPHALWNEFDQIVSSVQYMQTLLAYGYTTIRDLGSAHLIGIKMRDAVNSGRLKGPTIKACGPVLAPEYYSAMPCFSNLEGLSAGGRDGVRRAVRQTLANGADFIKIYATEGSSMGRLNGNTLFYEDEFEELERVCAHENVGYAAHSMSSAANWMCVEYGAYSVEHGLFWSKEDTDHLIKKGYKTNLVPTYTGMEMYLELIHPGRSKELLSGFRSAYEDGKIKIGFGTDAGEDQLLSHPAKEFTVREEKLGFKKIDILKQATLISAQINKTDDLRGSIKVGKRADLVIIDGKPDEDLSVFNAPPVYVIKDGDVVAQNGLISPTNNLEADIDWTQK